MIEAVYRNLPHQPVTLPLPGKERRKVNVLDVVTGPGGIDVVQYLKKYTHRLTPAAIQRIRKILDRGKPTDSDVRVARLYQETQVQILIEEHRIETAAKAYLERLRRRKMRATQRKRPELVE